MKAICVNGVSKQNGNTVTLPEFTPLSVREYDDQYYWVEGYERCPVAGLIVWHKRRFIPLSDIPEASVVDEQNHEALIYQR